MAAQDSLPGWVRVGGKCRWWSESQNKHHPVVVTSVDLARRRAVVHFEADHRVWKMVAFTHIGANKPLRPPGDEAGVSTGSAASAAAAGNASPRDPGGKAKPAAAQSTGTTGAQAAASCGSAAPGPPTGKEKQDGVATPPWYEQLWVAEGRAQGKDEMRRREEEAAAQQERRRSAWQNELQKQVEEERNRREEDKRRREQAAEADRLRILETLRKEREDEQRRQQEVKMMGREEEVTARVNAVWRQREEVARRQREEEEAALRLDEERRLQARLQEEIASRPRVSFGVRMQVAPAKILIPQVPVAAAPPPSPPQQSAPSTAAPSAAVGAAASTGKAEHYGALICAIYERHNPAKLADVPSLLDKYSGCEAEMYERICEKYGVEPEHDHKAVAEPRRGSVGYAKKASAPAPTARTTTRFGPTQLSLGVRRPSQRADAERPASAPSASSLLARFQSLVSAENAGASQSRSSSRSLSCSCSLSALDEEDSRDSGGGGTAVGSRRREEDGVSEGCASASGSARGSHHSGGYYHAAVEHPRDNGRSAAIEAGRGGARGRGRSSRSRSPRRGRQHRRKDRAHGVDRGRMPTGRAGY